MNDLFDIQKELIDFKKSIESNIKKGISWDKDLYVVFCMQQRTIKFIEQKEFNSKDYTLLSIFPALQKVFKESLSLLNKFDEK